MKKPSSLLTICLALTTLSSPAFAGEQEGIVVPVSTNHGQNAISSVEKNGKRYLTYHLADYAKLVNESVWSADMTANPAMTVKLQTLLDWNHASPGAIDGGWGATSKKALQNFQQLQGLEPTGKMNEATWQALHKNIASDQPILVSYTITDADMKGNYAKLPSELSEQAKQAGLYYENVEEMLGERFHMSVRYLKKINPDKKFVAGETITVINTGKPLDKKITHLIAHRQDGVLYAYHEDKLIATYPSMIGKDDGKTGNNRFKITDKVKMPSYKATINKDGKTSTVILPSGPNNPVGVAWLGINKPNCGIHGSPMPDIIDKPAELGCIKLTNWDILEVYANIEQGAIVEIR
ncbi:L,D-transpeptidase family protein [Moraxella sp.]|uniref:L,D-transpeptidase family protein n=1 Tax=Moraxella sp. TaxID=479 RepID=UPI0026DBA8EF|nr:L,D-transpeptidase family protein [Moraxella sp.]MDO4894326.1 L,D-transpeptidase family protein [Moraxella sp.]